MRCFICNSTDQWENVDRFRLTNQEMAICKNDGFVSYPKLWKSKEEIFNYYRKEYRPAPNVSNLYTGQRKLHFHAKFLNEEIGKWQKSETKPSIFEVGCAYGMFLDWFRHVVPGATVAGSELTQSMKRVAFAEYGLNLIDEIDTSKKYDMIVSYKVAEHQLDFDKELELYKQCLNDGGIVYISVPTWFDQMTNFGLGGFDIEYYYSTNHVNVWDREIFEYIMNRAGFEMVKKDTVIYDSTYIFKVNESVEKIPMPKHYEKNLAIMEKIKLAFDLFRENKFDEAMAMYPNFPYVYTAWYENNRKVCHDKGFDWTMENHVQKAINACPESSDPIVMATDVCMRFGRWREATKFAELGLKMKPENPVSLSQLANIMREMALAAKDSKERVHYFKQAREVARHLKTVSSQHFEESTNLIYKYSEDIPVEVSP